MRSVAALLALVVSALAYQVTEPTTAKGWTIGGPNVVAWDMVSTDNANFTIVLSNQASFPPTSQVLDALVDGTLGHITVNPPSGGFKTGAGFQVNFVKDVDNLSTILAQSNQFAITQGTNSSSTASNAATASTKGTGVLTITPTATSTTGTTDSADPANPTSSDTSTTPQQNGASSMGAQAGIFAGVALLGAFLA